MGKHRSKFTGAFKGLLSGKKSTPNTGTDPDPSQTPDPSTTSKDGSEVLNTVVDALGTILGVINETSDGFPPLKAAVGGVCECIRIYKQTSENQEKIIKLTEEIANISRSLEMQRKDGMSSKMEKHFENLSKKLESITLKAKEKQEHNIARRLVQTDRDSGDIDGFFNEIKNAYEECKTQVLFTIERDTTAILKHVVLQKLPYSSRAFYDADVGQGFVRPSCTPGTREIILNDIENWTMDIKPQASLGYWIFGLAGTGKSTIAKSMCESLEKKGLLGGSFFCSRQIPECRKHELVIPTIAYQIACYSSTFAKRLVDILEEKPDIPQKTPDVQLDMLLIRPWKAAVKHVSLDDHPVIVLDAIDECESILSVLTALISAIQKQQLLGLKFLFTSRPDGGFLNYFKKNMSNPYGEVQLEGIYLHNVETSLIEADIYKYLTNELELHSVSITDDNIKKLVKMSGRLFIYAATTVKFICDIPELSQDRLMEILSRTASPEKNQTQELDSLYDTILKSAIPVQKLSSKEQKDCLNILHTIITLGKPVPCSVIANMLDLKLEVVKATVKRLQSVFYAGKADSSIYIFHASFVDYLTTGERSGIFSCDVLRQNTLLATACFHSLMNLKFNICDLPSSFLRDKDVPDNSKRRKMIDKTLEYACVFWGGHLSKSDLNEKLIASLYTFVKDKIVFWIEAMNLLGLLIRCNTILEKAEVIEDIKPMIHEIQNLLTFFATSGLTQRTPHLYLSILPFWPECAWKPKLKKHIEVDLIRKDAIAKIQVDQEIDYTRYYYPSYRDIKYSPDGKILYLTTGKNIHKWNAATGRKLEPSIVNQSHKQLTFDCLGMTPDGERYIAAYKDGIATSHDIRTLKQIEPFPTRRKASGYCELVAFGNNKVAFAAHSGQKIMFCDLAADTWLCKTISPPSVIMRLEDIKEQETCKDDKLKCMTFSPDESLLVCGFESGIINVFDANKGDLCKVVQAHGSVVYTITFSPDGKLFLSGSEDSSILICYTDKKIEFDSRITLPNNMRVSSLAFSPGGEKFASGELSWDGSAYICIWNAITREPIGTRLYIGYGEIKSMCFSPDGNRIAVQCSSQYRSSPTEISICNVADIISSNSKCLGHLDNVSCASYSPDGSKILSIGQGSVGVWDAATGVPIQEVCYPSEQDLELLERDKSGFLGKKITREYDKVKRLQNLVEAAFSSDGSKCVIGSKLGTIWILNTYTCEKLVGPFQAAENQKLIKVGFSPDGNILATSFQKFTRLWNAETGESCGEISDQGHFVFTPDSQQILLMHGRHELNFWDVATCTKIDTLHANKGPWSLYFALSADGTQIVTITFFFTFIVQIWDFATKTEIGERFKTGIVLHSLLELSSDGKKLLCWNNKQVEIWDLTTRTLIGKFHGNFKTVTFSPDGTKILTTEAKALIRVWDIDKFNQESDDQDPLADLIPNGSGWICDRNNNELVWIPPAYRQPRRQPQNSCIISKNGFSKYNLTNLVYGERWAECYNG
ncbi:hypothetical protein K435DRAFT_966063 [Dendrothele bispora CBS 962.96]|uniref:Nephrocystin 3-like N-terminal domain-containing protein n=1 Tax=Dendrothele bispora (strain CBS 962.96) TaxID=1314807 RepID=A0A4S8M295_DENBC|nr:hypothetical protein K435DRAFT_966063 [Dendrothele bispora CBS 962.96]